MPSKKQRVNGFWLFAQKNKAEWRAQGLRVATNEEILTIASPLWKALSQAQRREWTDLAKLQKHEHESDTGVGDRFDNVGNFIGARINPFEETVRRLEKETYTITSKWHGKDLTEEKFYFINFEDMCELSESDNSEKREWLPREVALVEYCLKDGITNTYHQFIWPGDIPLGFRLRCESKSRESHQIPTERMEEDSVNYEQIWTDMLRLLKNGIGQDGEYPPLYCMSSEYEKMKYLVDWMWKKAADMSTVMYSNPLKNVYSLEETVGQLLAFSGKPNTQRVSRAQITSQLTATDWDFTPETTCEFHKTVEVSRHCSLAVVRRLAYTVSDMVAPHYDIELSENHLPIRLEPSAPVFRVMPNLAEPTPLPQTRGRGRNPRTSPTKMARPPRMARERQRKPEEQKRDLSDDQQDPKNQVLAQAWSPSPLAGGKLGKDSVLESSHGPADGQFDDWQQLPAPSNMPSKAKHVEEDLLSSELSAMRLTEASYMWAGGRGRGDPTGISVAHVAAPSIRPPPGFGSVMFPMAGRGTQHPNTSGIRSCIPAGRGMCLPTPSLQKQTAVNSNNISIGRGFPTTGDVHEPHVSRGPVLSAGRGVVPVAREDTRSPETRCFGRGRLLGDAEMETTLPSTKSAPVRGRGRKPNPSSVPPGFEKGM